MHLSGDVAGLDLLDDGAVDDVVDRVFGQGGLVQQTPGRSRDKTLFTPTPRSGAGLPPFSSVQRYK